MHQDLEGAAEKLGIAEQLPNLREAARHSQEVLSQAKGWLAAKVDPREAPNLDVVALGSYARLEASAESDFDYLVVAYGIHERSRVTRELLNAADEFIEEFLVDPDDPDRKRRPGGTGIFGRIQAAAELTERIGLEQDTNLSHTRRLLILEESTSIYQEDKHEELVDAILDRYLADYESPKQGVPRFLLNDVIRYWYTMAVDYQAKRWENDFNWGLRYLKLVLTRKLAYAGSLASLLRCEEATVDYLRSQFRKPPLARLAQLALDDEFERPESVRDALLIAEEFAGYLKDPERRQEAMEVRSLHADDWPQSFSDMRERSKDLQTALDAIFHDSHLEQAARKYLGF